MSDGAVLLLHLLSPLLAGVAVQAIIEPPARAWHQSLRKAPERPPALAFPLVWAYSYLVMGYASFVLSRRNAELYGNNATAFGTGMGAQVAHFLLLQCWQVVFLANRDIRGGLIVMISLDCVVPVMMACWYRVAPLVACLMLPYVAWLLLLTYMNWYMVEHNTGWGYSSKDEIVRLYNTPRDSDDEGEEVEGADGVGGVLRDGDLDVDNVSRGLRRRLHRSQDEAVVPGS